ncbi:MAG: nitronate monooxygenase [Deltaproteobacteria bacterium]|jgi:nitronate monooxygenase|nr:nitronate monooxygenase [Deltaproteobacteria bacterium]MBW2238899.1 nitronate monooxygenase [Deltaproteobacteria bacterium]MBW2570868.1 nitronate monooxygenase [Deltaproteobacteria bacterium]MBW2668612.1 nitronate monooxygenase [Deltaproteobacteria bacterium]MBW2711710.1 nitronate monooxygenase [Deltaproteobacteria bacterium]
MSIKTEFTQQFNVRYPIICAPMFLVSSVKMVVSACEAGGVGTFPALNYRPIERYRQTIKEIKSLTAKPFGINIIVQKSNKYQYKQIEHALEEKVPLIITSLGNPKEVIRLSHEVGTRVYCDVVGFEHAKKVADLGADGLIAVGFGAGGHAGDISPLTLIPNLVRMIKLPIIAAGSIVDGAGMAAAFALGASAVYMGTRFIASKEAEVAEEYKNAITRAKSEDIVNTDRVDGFPGNFIRTKELEAVGLEKGLIEEILTKNKKIKRFISLSRAARSLFGDMDSKVSYKTVYSAGHGVGLIDEVLSIQEIMAKTVREYKEIKAKLP